MAGLTRIKSDGIGDNCDFDGEGTLVLDSTNNRVGIGTSSPQQNLQINDSVTPAIRFSRDTSYYWDIGHTNSDFQFNSESGGTIMHLNFNGNVGIGTTSPSALLHLAANAPYITFEDKDNNQDWQLQATAWFALRDQTNNAERLRIDSSGRLLVGTTTEGAVNADNLTINDSGNCGLTIRSANTGSGNIYFSDSTSGTAEFAGAVLYDHNDDRMMLYSASTERLRIDGSGNVGIDTTSPQAPFVVSNGGAEGVEVGWSAGASSNYVQSYNRSTSAFAQLDLAGTPLLFRNGATEAARIDSSGRLLVGTTSASSNDGVLVVQGYGGQPLGEGTLDLIRGNNVTAGTQGLGSINFGHSQYKGASIDALSEGAWTEGSSHPAYLSLLTTAAGASSPTERMRIHSSGQIGMGTGGTNAGGSTVDVTVRMTPATSAYGLYASNFSSGTTSTPGGYGIYGHMGGTPPSGQAHYGLYGKVDTHSSRASGGLLAYSINNSVYAILGYWSTAAYYGMYSNGSVYAAGGFSSSDSRLKDIVSDGIGTGILDKVCNLQAKRFTWKDNTLQRRSCEDVLIGLLAQDVQTDFPEVVASVHQTKITGVNPETLNEQLGDNLAIDYGKLVPVLVEALKEAKTRIETLEAEVAALKSN